MSEKLQELEVKISNCAADMEAGGIRIAAYLSLVEDNLLWKLKRDEDGRAPRNFKHYLNMLAIELRDKQIRASQGSFERWLSFYRLFHQELGMTYEQIMLIGPTILDEVRKIIDWDYRERTIGTGENGKLDKDSAVDYINKIIDEMQEVGKIFTPALRDEVAERLGRTPLKLEITVRRIGDKCVVTQENVWEGADVHRLREGVDERIIHWIAMRTRAKITWVE